MFCHADTILEVYYTRQHTTLWEIPIKYITLPILHPKTDFGGHCIADHVTEVMCSICDVPGWKRMEVLIMLSLGIRPMAHWESLIIAPSYHLENWANHLLNWTDHLGNLKQVDIHNYSQQYPTCLFSSIYCIFCQTATVLANTFLLKVNIPYLTPSPQCVEFSVLSMPGLQDVWIYP